MKLNWITKNRYQSGEDVSISLVGRTPQTQQVQIIFRNGAEVKISKTKHVVIAIAGERLYFKDSSRDLGYKITGDGKNNSPNKYIKLKQEPLMDWVTTHAGDYPLEYDREAQLYYINAE